MSTSTKRLKITNLNVHYAKKYYNNFYKDFKTFMLQQEKASENYTGQNIKIIRTFFNWVNKQGKINVGQFHKDFYVINQEKPITVLSTEQLQYLMFDQEFEKQLTTAMKKVKDVFVFGCIVGLRYSDLVRIKKENIIIQEHGIFLSMNSKKTSISTMVKLPATAIEILQKYKSRAGSQLPCLSLMNFNKNLKQIGKLAKWDYPIAGRTQKVGKAGSAIPFYKCLSSHLMRKTSITQMLTSGMPEYVVKKISGHSNNSKSFYRYVSLSQSLVDTEIEKFHTRFQSENQISSPMI